MPGKNAEFHFNKVYGSLNNNTRHGIYGIYEDTIPTRFVPVAKNEEIKIGEAEIYTVLNGQEKKVIKSILPLCKNITMLKIFLLP